MFFNRKVSELIINLRLKMEFRLLQHSKGSGWSGGGGGGGGKISEL